MTTTARALTSDPAISAQATFRAVMSAMARPGTVWPLAVVTSAPQPLSPGAAAFALAMLDHETPVWLDAGLSAAPAVADWLRFQTGAPIVVEPVRAAFALVGDTASLPALEAFDPGSQEYPDRSTTIVLQVESLERGPALTLTGPGIRDRNEFRASPMPGDMAQRLATNRGLFPRGVDFVLVTEDAVAALPRSLRIVSGGA